MRELSLTNKQLIVRDNDTGEEVSLGFLMNKSIKYQDGKAVRADMSVVELQQYICTGERRFITCQTCIDYVDSIHGRKSECA